MRGFGVLLGQNEELGGEERRERPLGKVQLGSLTLWSGHGCSCRVGKGDKSWPGRRKAQEQVNIVPSCNIRYIKQWKECLKKS